MINISQRGEGTGGGMTPPGTARGSGGALIAPSVGSAFLLLRLFSMKFTVISIRHAISGLLEPAWIATRKHFILHNAMVPTAQQLNS